MFAPLIESNARNTNVYSDFVKEMMVRPDNEKREGKRKEVTQIDREFRERTRMKKREREIV